MDNITKKNNGIREYLLTQGEKYAFKDLWLRVIKTRLLLLDSLEDVNDYQATFKISKEEWSILEVANHVLKSSKNVLALVNNLANGQACPVQDIEPPREQVTQSIANLRNLMIQDSITWSAITMRLPEPPSFKIQTEHPFFGRLHARAWYLFQRLHDLDHLKQIQKI